MMMSIHLRRALTGTLTLLAMAAFGACAELPLAPADADPTLATASAATPAVGSLTSCTLVDGQWVCTTTDPGATTQGNGGGGEHCEIIDGALHCEPDDD